MNNWNNAGLFKICTVGQKHIWYKDLTKAFFSVGKQKESKL